MLTSDTAETAWLRVVMREAGSEETCGTATAAAAAAEGGGTLVPVEAE